MGKFAVPERHKALLLFGAIRSQSLNDDPKIGKAFVDIRGLLESESFGARFGLSLGASQVDDIYFAVSSLFHALLLVVNREDCVRPRRVLVHGVSPYHSDLFALVKQSQQLFKGVYLVGRQVLN